MNRDYEILSSFQCCGNNLLVVRMVGAACTMSVSEYNRIVVTERNHKLNKAD